MEKEYFKARSVYNVLHDEAVQFGFSDKRGREFGYSFVVVERGFIEDANGEDVYAPLNKPGVKLEIQPHATRGGKPFGALQSGVTVETLEAGIAKGKALAAKAAKRYATHKDRA